jgi:Gas vesicle synthesis protein GvpL/GvpF
MSLWVYALASRGARSRSLVVRGIAGERLRTVAAGPLVAIVGDMKARPRPTAENLVRYDRIVTKLWEQNSALLPARFGTRVGDVSELEVVVKALADKLRSRLAVVRNRGQMTVLIVDSRPRRPHMPRPRAKSGKEYLRAKRAAHDVPQFVPLRAAVQPWLKAERLERRGRISTIYHLVPRGAIDRYRSALERAARDAGVRLYILGPRAPYAFADIL